MRIFDYAKELTKLAGKQVTANEIIRILSKKKDGLRMTSEIDDELMEYAKMMITGKTAAKPVKKAAAPKPATPARKPAKKSSTKSEGDKEKPAAPKKHATLKPRVSAAEKAARAAAKAAGKPVPALSELGKTPAKTKAAEEEAKAAKAAEEAAAAEAAKAAEEEAKKAEEAAKAAAEAEAKAAAEEAAAKAKAEEEEAKAAEEAAAAEAAKAADEEAKKAEETKAAKPKAEKKDDKPKTEKKPERARGNDKPERSDRPAKTDRGDRPAKSDRPARPAKGEDAPVESSKRSSSRKGDKSKDKEKEARRENRETRTSRRDDKRRSKNNFRDMDEMTHERKKKPQKKQEKKEEETIKTITLPESLTLSEFAAKIKQPVNALIKKLFLEGKMYTVNTEIEYEEAELIALEYNIICEQEVKVDIVEEALKDIEDPEDSLVERPPVVCVMGHVDHGKTSLLDAIRKTSVTEGEAGGITQHIGAYTVKVGDKKITFLDTPGHEAFTAMRLRGAMATDIAILVVAADDGVMPQTVEAINHAKAAGIEIIVAVNKIDKPSANIERVKQELVEYGLIAEDWGGTTVFAPVSAKTHEGIDNLLEMILLTSDILELKANPKRKARGIVIEAKLDKGRGSVATLLVQKGTLKVGDFIAIGESHGRVRAMTDDKQRSLKEATPSMPVEIIGLSTVPNTGEIFIATDTEKEARSISDAFITRGKENLIAETKAKMSLDDIFSQMQEGTLKELNIIIKADVQGSVEALKQSLVKLSNNEIVIKCIHSGVGAINESDVSLAAASDAIIIGFNVRPEPMAKQLADTEKVDVRLYRVIYNAIDDIESAMKGMLDPIYEERVIGHAVVRQTFKASGVGTIAGTFVEDGAVERSASVRLSRNGEQIWEGKIASLKRFNDDAKEVKAGYECGIVLEENGDIQEGDTLEVYKMVEVPRD
ncbi:MAG: translation initiation factor IF-2 [Eubacterium sp.]|nr:translation initiation factor IF-2 [Eubacterium sp.]